MYYVRRDEIGCREIKVIRPEKVTEEAKEEIERELKEEGYIYVGKEARTSGPCPDYDFRVHVLEAEDVIVIDMTYYDGPNVFTEKHYYVKPPAEVVLRDIDVHCGPDPWISEKIEIVIVSKKGDIWRKVVE